ncbi:MAG: DMT family protein [Gemmataceae bacterium]|nr:DMT family protein [Gemmataceae bacterium]
MKTVLLLACSSLFMNLAWYGHLTWFKTWPVATTILASWLVALPEYSLQVPANRWGHGQFTGPQLKILAESLSLTMFLPVSMLVLKEVPGWRDLVGFSMIAGGVVVAMSGRGGG